MSCSKNNEEKLIHETAYNFSDKLFNYKYAEALTLATPESRRTIEFLASNLDEKAIEYLKETLELDPHHLMARLYLRSVEETK